MSLPAAWAGSTRGHRGNRTSLLVTFLLRAKGSRRRSNIQLCHLSTPLRLDLRRTLGMHAQYRPARDQAYGGDWPLAAKPDGLELMREGADHDVHISGLGDLVAPATGPVVRSNA
ncbi:hypothetical protein B0H14DRAFT_2655753 [Mycena olivaceomarginata]|nr:hypothetical protein B0H14DRAFT_2655753 [Mycena olivaceomarginata]